MAIGIHMLHTTKSNHHQGSGGKLAEIGATLLTFRKEYLFPLNGKNIIDKNRVHYELLLLIIIL